MKIIPVVVVNGVNTPSEPFPKNSIEIMCDGDNYICYQPGDDLPEVGGDG